MNEINYYKINEVLNHKYYQIPQELFENPLYKNNLNSDSKILYAFILDRLSLSIKSNWYDENGNIYLIFTRQEVQDKLCLSEKTVTKAFLQLSECKLICEKRQGLGKPNLIYVGKLQHENINKFLDKDKVQVLNRKIYGSETVDNTVQDKEKFPPINTDIIKTNIINTYSINQEENNFEISLKNIKEKCKIDDFEKNEKIILEDVIDTLYSSSNLKVGSVNITRSKILSKLELITKDNLINLLNIMKTTGKIQNITNYLMICLYNNLGNINLPKKNVISTKHSGREYSKEFLESLYDNLSMESIMATS